ncbi:MULTISPECIES: nucleoid occlusion factor SlmA [unclassified Pseudoalteromonas]|uniref:nucleoid occlusion factor SlmA n=1 Tax=unclassified Pseudoalteromonas TaxID=194690 RepID=UPI00072FD1FE|nr:MULTISPECIES: nucleoid occlusion factor SlmA [unclassified Pseudoalteromonas]KTD97634.1 TetR family transcriptional regulator [Pseudoalteromonas sp. H71]KTF10735.1 TetR family transcriptional regulator [Pseudoalteromonas sp. 10-33]MBW4966297.1 nucleoid occlusion factor SlmA [Pseudoalteromonas sp. CR1]TMN81841.1 nucleoid occlusion factor SlmA [Pseudoalteromonas sp. S410]TMN92004.1 nucleoid occlusion factor SlmA [Pseudoalteromonas sp. S408]|tara:strand:+ start:153 stop:740 length:588 start_codon:yes stop_codon:yes gene_type:complete
MPATKRSNRKEQILQALAQMLETSPGQRITTAKLAAEVGVSEAALYRHFPSKARMFEGLIEFIEDTLLSRINLILENEKESQTRIYNILLLLLTFAEKNPGITRILTGDALQGEQERLRERVQSFFEKLETQLKQVLRERKLREGKNFQSDELTLANFLLAYVEGKMNQFVRSDFKTKPSVQFEKQWPELQKIWL